MRQRQLFRRGLAAGAVLASVVACEGIPERSYLGLSVADSTDADAVVELRDGHVALLDSRLKVKWVYRPRFPPPAPHLQYLDPHLICQPARERTGPILLTYTREIHAIDRNTGRRLWKIGRAPVDMRRLPAHVLGSALVLDNSCPAVTPDSGMVATFLEGLLLRKYDDEGERSWHFDLERYGRAITGPHVLWPSGNILIRAKHHLLLLSPTGKLNATLPH